MELFYHHWNPSQKQSDSPPPTLARIVLLHGMGGTGALWRPIAASLENEIDLLAPDQRGHGKSRVSHQPGSRLQSGYSPKDYGQDVIDTLSAAQFYPTWLLGHSMGVRTAVAAAHLKPEWVQGLILVDLGFSGVAGGGLGDGLGQFLRKLPPQFDSRDHAKTFMKDHCPDPSIAQYLMAVSTRDLEGRISFPFDHAALIQTIQSARDFSVRGWVQELGEKGMPILVLRGAQSLVWSHEDFQKERETLKELSSIVFKEVPQAGHGLPFEQRAAFVTLLKDFILQRPQD